ncbi:Ail/Lom family outer membrane beta-barrel protein [Arsenophonus nasoniae]|uniref:Ail/Lom family outer membrane beta-barrel protein n=1 Tax=Arsenophonus nasoniae TaxID=638 RepID=A0AA95G8Z9_9GAMM|nr:Ail/Lom family outer membrane beta-barrel protein [Arsenophonus nasoniae]WGL94182.1 Ail/Lom family outer membrane beta-barrel protein [Arsenophonus nasoniae]
MKKILVSAVVASIFTNITVSANAAGKNTLSLDYAQSHLQFKDEEFKDKPKGVNIKYRYEIDNHWGFIGSLTYTHQEDYLKLNNIKLTDVDMYYSSLNFGPSYRFNKNISIYGLIGAARARIEAKSPRVSTFKDTETELVYGVGLQINPVKNIAFDVAYEYSKLSFEHSNLKDIKFGTWMLGVGYRF